MGIRGGGTGWGMMRETVKEVQVMKRRARASSSTRPKEKKASSDFLSSTHDREVGAA